MKKVPPRILVFLASDLALALLYYVKFDKENKASWTLLLWPLVFTTLSLDEAAKIHEWLGGKIDFLFPGRTRENTQVCGEELGEMIGATFSLWAAYELLRSHGFSLEIAKTAKPEAREHFIY